MLDGLLIFHLKLFGIMKKKIFFLSMIILLPILAFHNCLAYLIHLGSEQVRILSMRQNIKLALKSPELNQKLKEKLKVVMRARKFAIEKLALNPEGGFELFVNLDREQLGWHVTASYPLEFKSYTWWFPIVGNVPYKGYFSREKAKLEQKKLIEKGLDTRLRITAGYSTLGWFSDPVFSTQLTVDDDAVMALVFHEMAHGTVYFNGDALFNESYASFVEKKGTELYYQWIKDPESEKILKKRRQIQKKNQIVLTEIQATAKRLDIMYKSEKPDEQKYQQKAKIIQQFKEVISEKLRSYPNFDANKLQKKQLNNEDFIGALRYSSGGQYFKQEYEQCKQKFSCFHKKMATLIELSNEERKKLLQ